MAKKPLEIDMIAGSQLRDTQGEMLSVEGADITDLTLGKGRINDNHGKGFFNAIGRITHAKKIFKSEDCDDDRQKYYWDKVKAPYIYVKAELYDDEDHPNARAAAAILRNLHKTDCPLQLKASVEGGVISRGISDNSLLARTKIHSIALTFTPANNNTLVEPISLGKSFIDEATDMLLIKSVLHLAENNVPSFRHIVRDASATKVHENLLKLVDIIKELGIEGQVIVPSKQQILQKALEAKIENNILKIHEVIYMMQNGGDMEKGVKNALAGAAMAAGLSLGSPVATANELDPKQPAQVKPAAASHEDVYKRVAGQYPLLGAIGQVESTGGKNLNHQTVDSPGSMNHGHTAGGVFGMMPHSAAFVLKKDPELAKKYPELVEASKDMKANHKKFTDKLNSDPEAAADLAISMYKRNKSKTKNEHMLTYSWLNGLKGSWNKYKKEGTSGVQKHPYVQSVMEEYSKAKPKKHKLNKALMAGYGGGGAPTSRVGGAVIQAESLEDGRAGFKYLTCNNCGKEQIYAKFQVKCRECGQSLSLEKLYDAMHGKKK
jgi:hypothetical protein